MRVSRWWLAPTAGAVVLVGLSGCNEKPSVVASNAEAKVTGTVKVMGKPMTSGTVTLDPSNFARENAGPRTGAIKSDGTFEVTTLVGKNTVLVTGPEITKNPGLGYANEIIDVPSDGMTHHIVLPPPKSTQ